MPIELKDVHFSFDTLEQPLFQHVSLTIDTTWKLGLVGRNGRGKTTLLELLMQQHPYSGTIFSTEPFVYFPQPIRDEQALTYYAIDEVMPVELWQLERECQLLGLDKAVLWQPFAQLSGGEQTKVLLAALFCDETSFALLDEPTNHLDAPSRQLVANYLKKKSGFIVVSHDRIFLDEVVDHILAIEKQQLSIYKGDFSTYMAQKTMQDHYELAQNKTLKAEITRLQHTASQKAAWATKKEQASNDAAARAQAAKMMKRSKAIEARMHAQIEEKSKLLHNIESAPALTMNCLRTHRKPILRVKNVTILLEGKPLFQPLTFDVYEGERVALIGPNGSGKSLLLRYLVTGATAGIVEGELHISSNVSMSVIEQQHAPYSGTLKDFAAVQALDYTLLLNNLRILGFERDVFTVPMEQMSQGQQKKVELAKSLGIPAELYVWDEPLNYVDVFNHTQIETMLRTFEPTLLFVEHDAAFVESIATKYVQILPI